MADPTVLTVAVGLQFGVGAADANLQAVDLANGNTFANDGHTVLMINNGSGSGLDVTFTIPAGPLSAGQSISKVVEVGNAKHALMGPFPVGLYSSTVRVGWESGTSVTAAPVSIAI